MNQGAAHDRAALFIFTNMTGIAAKPELVAMGLKELDILQLWTILAFSASTATSLGYMTLKLIGRL